MLHGLHFTLVTSPDEPLPSLAQMSPRSMGAWEEVALRVAAHGGAALAVDYGEEGPIAHSLQAIRQHAFVDVLDRVGSADLSAHVDFGALRLAAAGAAERAAQLAGATQPAVRSYGPVTQRALLASLGIEARLNALLQRATDEQAEALIRGAQRLVGDDAEQAKDGGKDAAQPPGMGVRYKAMALAHADLPVPVGFESA
jgi:NADH dehydrogenase [ubiquinone] 1 alpha subcomplex assembly factor 7